MNIVFLIRSVAKKNGVERTIMDKVNALAIVFTTFIPRYMMTKGQLFAIEKEHWEKWSQAYMNFMKEAPDGTLTLKLEP